jgi:fucose permease
MKMLLNFFLVFLFSSFIQMGFPIIFQPAQFVCEPGEDCSEAAVCARGEHVLSPEFKSVAYSFDLVCDRKGFLRRCFESFLVGGFLGSLYFGEIIERYGRRHAVLQSLLMMMGGLYLSCVSGSAWIFSLGVFFFNAGFRGFYNSSLLSISEVTG